MASISRRDWVAPALAALLALACYLPALNGEPIAEDRALIFESPATRTPSAALASFARPFWHGIKPVQPYYRPLPVLTWSLERWIAGNRAAVFHATNIGLHALNAALAALLVLGLGTLATVGASRGARFADRGGVSPASHPASPLAPSTAGALFAGALVAVHPLHSEPVAALYGRPDLLAATGTLLFLNLAVRGRWLLSVLALAGALFSKESAVLVPLLVPAAFAIGAGWRERVGMERSRPGGSKKEGDWAGHGDHCRHGSGTADSGMAARTKLRERLRGLFGLGQSRHTRAEHGSGPKERRRHRVLLIGTFAAGCVLGVYLLMRYVALGAFVDPVAPHPLDNPLVRAEALERWLTPLAVVARTARIAIWPDSLCADRGSDTVPLGSGIGDPCVLAGAGLLLLVIILIAMLAARRSPWALPASAALLAWLPASNLIVLAPVLMADRLFYMPSIFICVLAGGLWSGFAARRERAREATLFLALAIAVVGGLAVRTFVRASDFRTEISFYESDTRQCPRSVKVHYNLGNVLARGGRHAEAVESFARATAIDPTLAIAHSNRAASFLAMGRLEESERAYREALAIEPSLVTARASLAGVLLMMGRPDEALREAEAAFTSNPTPSDAAQIRELIERIRRRALN